jgi:glycosyl transferase, family 25
VLNYFDRVYIINLSHRTDRKKEIEDQFSKIGVEIDGDHIRFFSAIRPDEAAGFPTLGTRGCFLSHLAVLAHAKESAALNVLLIEDDCNFVGNFQAQMLDIQKALPREKWGFFYGGTLNAIEPCYVKNGWLAPVQGVMGSHFFAVNGTLLAELVAYLEAMLKRPFGDPLGGPMHVDGAYSWFREANPEIKTYLAEPELAYQRSSATDIHPQQGYKTLSAVRWALRYFRKIKNVIVSSNK